MTRRLAEPDHWTFDSCFFALGDGFDGQRYIPAAGAAGGFMVERPGVPKHLHFSLGLFLHVADDAVMETDSATGDIRCPLDAEFTINCSGRWGCSTSSSSRWTCRSTPSSTATV